MNHVLIITGPTAGGKTARSEKLARAHAGQIINADIGQFYAPLSIGTAKPDLLRLPYGVTGLQASGFDLLHEPRDITVVAYRELVLGLVDKITKKKQLPILVGGSLFYIKSLFFPPILDQTKIIQKSSQEGAAPSFSCHPQLDRGSILWESLNIIDPERAAQIHPHDIYRIQRALDIWHQTGVKPSQYKPVFNPPFKATIIFVCPEREILNERIKARVKVMINNGWLEEAEKLIGTDWESFLQKKGLIGYPELIDWIKQGKQPDTLEQVIKKIEIQTIDYAKRQVTFWKSFARQLEEAGACLPDGWCSIQYEK